MKVSTSHMDSIPLQGEWTPTAFLPPIIMTLLAHRHSAFVGRQTHTGGDLCSCLSFCAAPLLYPATPPRGGARVHLTQAPTETLGLCRSCTHTVVSPPVAKDIKDIQHSKDKLNMQMI